MKKEWQARPFEECIDSVSYPRKIQRKDFLENGEYPIVSQEDAFINGYWNDHGDVFRIKHPVVIFGDHTRVLKFIDFDFVVGADGVKILQPKEFLIPKFFYYHLLFSDVGSLGYSRHYRLLKELSIVLPPLSEQRGIVGILDEAFAAIAAARANTEKNLQNARALFESHLNTVFSQKGDGWVEKRLGEVGKTCTGSTPKTAEKDNYGDFIPFIKPADFNSDGSLDYENDGLSKKGANEARIIPAGSVLMVCIGATIGKCGYCERAVATNQQINALIPSSKIDHRFLYYQMLTNDFQGRVMFSSAQATLPIINKSKWSALTISIPQTIHEQECIAGLLDALSAETRRLEGLYTRKLEGLTALKQSLLHAAFSGEL